MTIRRVPSPSLPQETTPNDHEQVKKYYLMDWTRSTDEQFNKPSGVSLKVKIISSSYVVDAENHRMQKFGLASCNILQFGRHHSSSQGVH